MAPVHSGFGASSDDIDTIDLTFSSPEPEERPRVPFGQRKLTPYLKREFKDESQFDSPRATLVPQRYVPERVASRVHTKPRSIASINPHHMAQIINTSDPSALREVLVDLCKMSPALSGAVARGLARRSTFGQGLIRQQVSSSRSVKHEPNEDHSYERMNQRLGTFSNSAGPSRSQSSSSRNLHPSASMSDLRIKREHRRDSSSEPDLELRIPSSISSSIRKSKSFNSPQPNASSSNTSSWLSKPPPFAGQFANTQNPSKVKEEEKVCTQCHDTYKDDFETCFYHPGPMFVANYKAHCAKCRAPMKSLGCAIGMHLTESDINEDRRLSN